MVDPIIFAETVTPSSFWPAAAVIDPLNCWSAAYDVDAIIAAAVAKSMLRILVIYYSPVVDFIGWAIAGDLYAMTSLILRRRLLFLLPLRLVGEARPQEGS